MSVDGAAGTFNVQSAIASLGRIGDLGTMTEITRVSITPMVLANCPVGIRVSPTRSNDRNTYYSIAFPIVRLSIWHGTQSL